MNWQTIYEDRALAAFNKPAGENFDGILNKKELGGGPSLIPVHRLDKDTSGIILFAKNQETADYLKKLFQNREVKKTYLALIVGVLKNGRGTIDLPIGRSKKTPLKRVSIGEQRGRIREAVTEFKVLRRFDPRKSSGREEYTLLEVYPKTGRTHQIRSHFAAIGHPVVCDKLYAGKKFTCPAGLKRQFLHASGLEFTLPSGSRLRLEADLSDDLENVKLALCQVVKKSIAFQ